MITRRAARNLCGFFLDDAAYAPPALYAQIEDGLLLHNPVTRHHGWQRCAPSLPQSANYEHRRHARDVKTVQNRRKAMGQVSPTP